MIAKYKILLLRELPPLLSPIRRLNAAILSPGSTKSDLNLLFLFSSGSFPSDQLSSISKTLENEINHQFGGSITVNPVPKILPELDKYFLAQILRDGYVVYGEPRIENLDLSPITIISFRLRGKTQQEKTKLSYLLYGRKIKLGGRERIISGLLEKAGGEQLGPGTLLVPDRTKSEITDILNKEKINFTEKRVWTNA